MSLPVETLLSLPGAHPYPRPSSITRRGQTGRSSTSSTGRGRTPSSTGRCRRSAPSATSGRRGSRCSARWRRSARRRGAGPPWPGSPRSRSVSQPPSWSRRQRRARGPSRSSPTRACSCPSPAPSPSRRGTPRAPSPPPPARRWRPGGSLGGCRPGAGACSLSRRRPPTPGSTSASTGRPAFPPPRDRPAGPQAFVLRTEDANGRLFEPGDVGALASSVAELLSDECEREDVGEETLRIVTRHGIEDTLSAFKLGQ